MDPVTEFIGLLSKEAATDRKTLQQREFDMWQKWKDGGMKHKDLRPLLKSIRPLIDSEASQWARQRDVPPAAIRAEFTSQAVEGLRTYDPKYGAQINTHLRSQMRRARRFITKYQNTARIPETRVYKVQKLQNATTYLQEQLGREPTEHELADEMQWSPKQVSYLQKEVRKTLPTTQFRSDPMSIVPSKQAEILRLLPYELTMEEKQVFEYLYGFGGKPKLAPGAIAKKLNMSAPKVSRLKKSIAEKYKQYAEGI